MAKGSSVTVPATPARGGSHDDYDTTPGTDDLVTTRRSVSFVDSAFDPDAKPEDEYVHGDDDLEVKSPAQEPDLLEEAEMFVTKSGGERSLARNLADEFDETDSPEPAEDDVEDFNEYSKSSTNMAQLTTTKDGHRPPINGDTPAANKTIGQCLKAIQETSKWIQLFAPKPARQAVWTELVEELSYLVNSTTSYGRLGVIVAGMATHAYLSKLALEDWSPSEAGAELHKWKKKLKAAFGSQGVGVGRQPRSDKEHLRDYLNRLNGYTRSANVKFGNGGRETKEHVKHFLETCGDRDLERQLTPMQLRDIHDLEDIVSDIQRVEKRIAQSYTPRLKPTLESKG
ncbi:LOW QUALITY PROTEIN: Eukaryotic/viral aspartic protease [Phytophthora megakarya]|uniref:Eukaryotic/viral aspartic protease n=1 Tax=Phytophthora megakarya TaxID=4795 RepID=A0A225UZ34_9STRA|nr:LOW QUALITY PROTEIN: Eukaryotic/viral aspartic protease [Phytophthora megakarya]